MDSYMSRTRLVDAMAGLRGHPPRRSCTAPARVSVCARIDSPSAAYSSYQCRPHLVVFNGSETGRGGAVGTSWRSESLATWADKNRGTCRFIQHPFRRIRCSTLDCSCAFRLRRTRSLERSNAHHVHRARCRRSRGALCNVERFRVMDTSSSSKVTGKFAAICMQPLPLKFRPVQQWNIMIPPAYFHLSHTISYLACLFEI